MSNINNQTQDLFAIEAMQDLDNETAAAVSGGQTVGDVTLSSGRNQGGRKLEVNNGIRDLRRFNFNNITSSVAVNSGTWRFYTGFNFTGRSFDVAAETGQNVPRGFDNTISSLRAIS